MSPFLYTIVASSLHDATAVERITANTRTVLDNMGGRAGRWDEAPDRPFFVLTATGGTEQAALDLLTQRRTVVPYEPAVLVAHGRHNSLPAAMETLARLRQDGRRGRIVYLEGLDGAARLVETIDDVELIHRLRRTRIGLVGEPSDWLVASSPEPSVLADRWGISLVPVDTAEALRAFSAVPAAAACEAAVEWIAASSPEAPSEPEIVRAARVHPSLQWVISAHRLDAVAVRCFDLLTELRTSGCLALAKLNDDGVVAGCEGDVASTVAMLLIRHLLDQPAWIANSAQIDESHNRIVLAHCTVAPSLVDRVELSTHFESGIGVGIRGRFEPGWVTLLRIGGPALDDLWVAHAEVVAAGDSPDLCRTQITAQVVDRPATELLDRPLGNHLVVARGRHADRIQRWWELAFGEQRVVHG